MAFPLSYFCITTTRNVMILKIYDSIVNDDTRVELQFWGLDGVSFKSIDEAIASIPANDDTIDLRINCDGGDCLTGWAIIDKLRATGKKISATIEGHAASMASLILLAASERKGYKHAQLLIHKPYFPAYTLADAYREEDLKRLATQLEDETRRALDFMVERTGADRATLEALMDEDKFVDMTKAKELGFIHEIIEPASATVKGWPKMTTSATSTTTHMSNNNDNNKLSLMQMLGKMLGLSVNIEESTEEAPAPSAYVLTTQDGTELTIDKPEGEDPAVGDAASPDGEHLMPDGTTIVVADGVITEIRDAESDEQTTEDPEEAPEEKVDNSAELQASLETANATIAELQARIAELEGSQMSAEQTEIVALVEKAGGMAWLKKSTQSAYTPDKRQRNEQTVEPKASKTATELGAIKAKRAARRKSTKSE